MGSQGFAHQQWWARIETIVYAGQTLEVRDSPTSNGGRGLKLRDMVLLSHVLEDSPTSNGGRGLKLQAKL